ncbi:hypothetical protein Avbf_16055, partial [Armadillidium vulgare]
LRSYSSISINLFIFIAYSARFPDSKRLEYYQSYIFLSPLERNLRCYSDYNNPIPINILFPLSDKFSLLIHQFPILIGNKADLAVARLLKLRSGFSVMTFEIVVQDHIASSVEKEDIFITIAINARTNVFTVKKMVM